MRLDSPTFCSGSRGDVSFPSYRYWSISFACICVDFLFLWYTILFIRHLFSQLGYVYSLRPCSLLSKLTVTQLWHQEILFLSCKCNIFSLHGSQPKNILHHSIHLSLVSVECSYWSVAYTASMENYTPSHSGSHGSSIYSPNDT